MTMVQRNPDCWKSRQKAATHHASKERLSRHRISRQKARHRQSGGHYSRTVWSMDLQIHIENPGWDGTLLSICFHESTRPMNNLPPSRCSWRRMDWKVPFRYRPPQVYNRFSIIDFLYMCIGIIGAWGRFPYSYSGTMCDPIPSSWERSTACPTFWRIAWSHCFWLSVSMLNKIKISWQFTQTIWLTPTIRICWTSYSYL